MQGLNYIIDNAKAPVSSIMLLTQFSNEKQIQSSKTNTETTEKYTSGLLMHLKGFILLRKRITLVPLMNKFIGS